MRAIVTRVLVKPFMSVYDDAGVLIGESTGSEFMVYQKQFPVMLQVLAHQEKLANRDEILEKVREASHVETAT